MASNSVTWLSRLARHQAPHKEALAAERRRRLWNTKAEEIALNAGAEADEEAQRLRRQIARDTEAARHRLEEAQNHSAHLGQRLLFEQARTEAWKAASFSWREAAEASQVGHAIRHNLEEARKKQEAAERSERVQAAPDATPVDGVARAARR